MLGEQVTERLCAEESHLSPSRKPRLQRTTASGEEIYWLVLFSSGILQKLRIRVPGFQCASPVLTPSLFPRVIFVHSSRPEDLRVLTVTCGFAAQFHGWTTLPSGLGCVRQTLADIISLIATCIFIRFTYSTPPFPTTSIGNYSFFSVLLATWKTGIYVISPAQQTFSCLEKKFFNCWQS